MSAKPSLQLYPGDLLKDGKLSLCSATTFGIYMRLLLYIFDNDTGEITGTMEMLTRACFATHEEMTNAIKEFEFTGAADVRYSGDLCDCHTIVTVVSRRLKRECKERENNRLRKQKERKSQKSHNNVPRVRAEVEDEVEKEKEVDTKVNTKSEGSKVKVSNHARRFDEFWKEYPKKRAKQKCLQKWKTGRYDDIADQLIADVKKRKLNDERWRRNNGQYIPDPLTYLNGKRWEDEMETKPDDHNPLDAFPTFNG